MVMLTPHLPFDPVETPLSWATRLAAFHIREGVVPFLHDLGIQIADMIVNRENAIERLCTVTGEEPEKVWRNCIRLNEWRHYSFRGVPFTAEFLHGKSTFFCPACLDDDDEFHGGYGQRRGKLEWLFRTVRTCGKHMLPLLQRGGDVWTDKLRQLQVLVPETGSALMRLAEDMPVRPVAPLQTYVTDRLDGLKGPDWLDAQPIEAAARATEMLGVVLVFGPKPNLKTFTEDDWDLAGRAGFQFTARGEDGVIEGLTEVRKQFEKSGVGNAGAGPQMVYGRLYQWLEFSKSGKDPGPIKDLLREHILDTTEIAPGRNLLGLPVASRRRHTVQSLAAATGTHPKTVRNLLISRGMLPDDPDLARCATVDAVTGEYEVATMKTSVPQIKLPSVLNTTRGQVIQLIEAGFLPLIAEKKHGVVRRSCPAGVVDAFLCDLLRHARIVDEKPQGVMGIPDAAQAAFVPTALIVRLVVSGELKRIYKIAGVPGYGGVLVDPAEVRKIGKPPVPVEAVPPYRAARQLGLSLSVVNALITLRQGGPLLPTVPGNKRAKVMIHVSELDRFARDCVGLIKLSGEMGIHHIHLRRKLDAAGVAPIGDPAELGARIYRRSDIRLD